MGDTTWFKQQHHLIMANSTPKISKQKHNNLIDDIHPTFSPQPLLSHAPPRDHSELPLITEDDDNNQILAPDTHLDTALKELNIDSSCLSPSKLSPTQIKEMITAIVNHQ